MARNLTMTRSRLSRDRLLIWSDHSLSTVTYGLALALVLVADGFEGVWSWVAALALVSLVGFALKTTAVFFGDRSGFWLCRSLLRPWRWQRGRPADVTDVAVVRESSEGLYSMSPTSVVGEHVFVLRIRGPRFGDQALIAQDGPGPVLELARSLAVWLAIPLVDASGDDPVRHEARDVAALPLFRQGPTPAPGPPPGRLRVRQGPVGPVVDLPRGSSILSHNFDKKEHLAVGLTAAALLLVVVGVPVKLLIAAALPVVLLYSMLTASALFGPARVEIDLNTWQVRALHRLQLRAFALGASTAQVQSVTAVRSAVALQLADREVTLALGKLTDEEASWLRDWLAHQIGERCTGRPGAPAAVSPPGA